MGKEYEYVTDSEEYEIVPVTPLRRLEKKIEMLERNKSNEVFNRVLDKLIDLTEINQRIVEEMVRSNSGLREDIEILVAKMNALEDKMNDFVDILKNIAEAELKEAESKFDPEAIAKTISETLTENISPVFSEMGKKLEELVNKMNDENKNLIQVLIAMDKKLKKLTTIPNSSSAMNQGVPQHLKSVPGQSSLKPAVMRPSNSMNMNISKNNSAISQLNHALLKK